jgi:hypothetical protein
MTKETDEQLRAMAAERAAVGRTASAAEDAPANRKAKLFREVAYLDERLDELLRRLARDPGRTFRTLRWP